MNRHEYALQAASAPHQVNFVQLAEQFALAAKQSTAEGINATTDPAVLLLGSFIAFRVHADVNTMSGYHKLIDLCNDALHVAKSKVMQ